MCHRSSEPLILVLLPYSLIVNIIAHSNLTSKADNHCRHSHTDFNYSSTSLSLSLSLCRAFSLKPPFLCTLHHQLNKASIANPFYILITWSVIAQGFYKKKGYRLGTHTKKIYLFKRLLLFTHHLKTREVMFSNWSVPNIQFDRMIIIWMILFSPVGKKARLFVALSASMGASQFKLWVSNGNWWNSI